MSIKRTFRGDAERPDGVARAESGLPSFNLVDEPWIPVIWRVGKPDRVGLRTALTEAGRIRQIAASNPMDNVALLRFLLAVLQWCKPELSEDERTTLNEGDGIPSDWLTQDLGTEGKPAAVFNLLGDGPRFFQDKSVAQNNRPIGDLLVEFPTETKVVHFRHVRDKHYGLCPACCALGIIRFCVWANAYGGGRYTSAVNGPTPAYAIPQGATLLQTLVMNWPGAASNPQPPWLSDNPPAADSLNTVTVFAWRSRRLWLGDPQTTDEPCAYCGQRARLIKQHAFTGNWKPPFETKGQQKKFWDKDPHLVLEEKTKSDDEEQDAEASNQETVSTDSAAARKKKGAKQKVLTTLGFPLPGSSVTAHTRFWRRALRALLSRPEAGTWPQTVVAGPAANKGLYQNATAVKLPAVSSTAAKSTQDALSLLFNVTEQLMGVLKRSTPNPARQHPNRKAALDALTPKLEDRLRDALSCWLGQYSPDERTLKDNLETQLQPFIGAIVSATTAGSPLRRREAQARARMALQGVLNAKPKAAREEATPANRANTATIDSSKLKRRQGRGKKKEAAQ